MLSVRAIGPVGHVAVLPVAGHVSPQRLSTILTFDWKQNVRPFESLQAAKKKAPRPKKCGTERVSWCSMN